VLAEVDRQLAHEAVVTTHNHVLGVACLQAATSLAVSLQHPSSVQVLDQVAALLQAYCQPGSSPQMKAAAYSGLLQVSAGKAEAMMRIALYASHEEQQLLLWQQQQQQLAAAAAADGGNIDQYAASIPQPAMYYSEVYKTLPPAQLSLDAVLGLALRLVEAEPCPVQKAGVLREALLVVGQLEQQGKLALTPTATLPSLAGLDAALPALPAAAAGTAGAAAAAAAAAVHGTGEAGAAAPAAGVSTEAQPPQQPQAAAAAGAGAVVAAEAAGGGEGGATAAPPAAPAAAGNAAAADGNPTPPSAAAAAAGTQPAPGDNTQQDEAAGAIVPVNPSTAAPDDVTAAIAATAATAAAGGVGSSGVSGGVVLPLSLAVLCGVHGLMWHHGEPPVRQLAFMLLQKLAGQPPTLYRCEP